MNTRKAATRKAPEAQARAAGTELSAGDTLLKAASDLMIEAGTFDVSLHAIARKAGLTAPLVKYYFGSKDGLLVALVKRDTRRSLLQLQELLAMKVDPATKLRHHITGIIRTYARYPYLNALLDNIMKDDTSDAAEQLKASFVVPLIDAQRAIIEAGVASGQFRPIDPVKAYFLIIGACQYIFTTRLAFRHLMKGVSADDDFARDYAIAATDIILHGISTR